MDKNQIDLLEMKNIEIKSQWTATTMNIADVRISELEDRTDSIHFLEYRRVCTEATQRVRMSTLLGWPKSSFGFSCDGSGST